MKSPESSSATTDTWFARRLPSDWSVTAVEVVTDREEITVTLTLPVPSMDPQAGEGERAEALAGSIARFRAETRDRRIAIAREAEQWFGRKVSWGVRAGGHTELFTHLAVPVMTRLRQPERQVLDTLVDAGVARSRAHALAWCVRLVDEHAGDWLGELRSAMAEVAKVRAAGPGAVARAQGPGAAGDPFEREEDAADRPGEERPVVG